MPKETPKTKLPPERYFTLSHILSHSDTGLQDIQRLNDSIINTTKLYSNDVSEQLASLSNVEDELLQKLCDVNRVYDVVHNIRLEDITDSQILKNGSSISEEEGESGRRSSRRVKGKGLSVFGIQFNKSENNRLEQYREIEDNIEELVNETVMQKKRLDSTISRLKKLELALSKRERLFDLKSSNQTHYKTVFNYAMKNDIKKERREERRRRKTNQIIAGAIDKDVVLAVSTDKTQKMQSIPNFPKNSKISQQKINQYLDIENELEEMKAIRTSKSVGPDSAARTDKEINAQMGTPEMFNPVSLISNKTNSTATCKLNEETVTVRSDIETLKKSQLEDASVNTLVDELKKLYN